ncbi:hypothetical protein BD410DRAFT_637180 [Rickenella mellea]|uniref:Uncharacterized protein n=1 Tax=Rickenella mellea TaxID=50990 RepID=A0A4Y7QCP8_9AGAM|nr:hypothetical protein BD410DRAFT_637180 [Rickenella mellea]
MSWASSDSAERTLLWVQAHSSSPASSASRSRTNPQQDEKKEKERREEAQQTPSRMLKHKRNHITSSALVGAELQPGSQHTSVQVKPSTQVPPKPYPKPSSSMVPEPSVLESGRREQTRRGSVDQGHSRQPSRPYIPQDFVQPSMQSQQPPKPQYQRSSSQSRPQPTRSQSLTRPAQDPLQTTARTNVQPQSAAHSKSASQVPVYSYQKPPLSPQDQKSAQYTYAQPPQSPVDAQAPPKPTYVKPPKIPTPVLAAAQLPAFPQGQPGSGYPYRMTPVQPQPVPAAAYRPGAVPVAAPAPTSPPPLVGTPMNPKKSRPISQRRRPSLSGTVFEPPPPDKTHTSQNSIHSQHRRDDRLIGGEIVDGMVELPRMGGMIRVLWIRSVTAIALIGERGGGRRASRIVDFR